MWYNIADNMVVAASEPEKARFKFKCRKCGKIIITDEITIPAPNTMGDTSEESRVYTEETIICPKCGEEHEIQISNDYGGVYANIDDVDEKDIFIEPL